MFTAFALAAASIAAPPVTVTVHAAPGISRTIVEAALDEAAAIWHTPGLTLVWQIEEDLVTSLGADRRTLPLGASLRVLFDDGPSTAKDYVAAIGWIVFANDAPLPEIHLSHANALEIMRAAYGDGGVNRMPIAQRRTLVSRALGRALAHEVGHYLLGSKEHTARGLMKARQTANDLFGPEHKILDITEAQRCAALARLVEAEHLARR